MPQKGTHQRRQPYRLPAPATRGASCKRAPSHDATHNSVKRAHASIVLSALGRCIAHSVYIARRYGGPPGTTISLSVERRRFISTTPTKYHIFNIMRTQQQPQYLTAHPLGPQMIYTSIALGVPGATTARRRLEPCQVDSLPRAVTVPGQPPQR